MKKCAERKALQLVDEFSQSGTAVYPWLAFPKASQDWARKDRPSLPVTSKGLLFPFIILLLYVSLGLWVDACPKADICLFLKWPGLCTRQTNQKGWLVRSDQAAWAEGNQPKTMSPGDSRQKARGSWEHSMNGVGSRSHWKGSQPVHGFVSSAYLKSKLIIWRVVYNQNRVYTAFHRKQGRPSSAYASGNFLFPCLPTPSTGHQASLH